MSHIRMIAPEAADDELRAVYGKVLQGRSGAVPPILQVLGLNPPALDGIFGLANAITFGGSSLGRRREEMIATRISALNECAYCTTSHGEFLRAATRDDALVYALQNHLPVTDLDPQDRAMLAFAEKLNAKPSAVGRDDVDRLRDRGFDDRNVLDIVLIVGLFNLMNRVAEGLGLEPLTRLAANRRRAEARLAGNEVPS